MSIGKGAADPAAHRRPSLFYASAREGFQEYLAGRDATGAVLLPAFVGQSAREGSGVLDPVRRLGLRAEFYRVNRDLTADVDDLERLLEAGRHCAVVLIHYYGRTDPATARICAAAHARGVPLVEDLAHGFFSAAVGGSAGAWGELSLFSLHKMLPIPDGGVARYACPEAVGAARSTRPDLAATMLEYDWHAIARARRDTFTALQGLLAPVVARRADLEPVWSRLAPGDVPQTLPVYVSGGGRDAVYERLNGMGFGVVSLYHTLVDEVAQDPRHSSAHWSARHILNLPVHQDVPRTELPALVAALEQCLDELQDSDGC